MKMRKLLRQQQMNSDYFDFCYDNMSEIKCTKLNDFEKQKVIKIIDKLKKDGYPNFPAVKDCFFNSILISLFSKEEIQYVEGWYWDIIPSEHGWCKIGSAYFDPTVLFNSEEYSSNIAYYGMIITPEEIAEFGVSDLEGKNPEIHCVIPELLKNKKNRNKFG